MELEMAWVGPQVVWGRVSGNHQGEKNSISQVDGDSGMAAACICTLGGGGGSTKK